MKIIANFWQKKESSTQFGQIFTAIKIDAVSSQQKETLNNIIKGLKIDILKQLYGQEQDWIEFLVAVLEFSQKDALLTYPKGDCGNLA